MTIVCLSYISIFIMSIPVYYKRLLTECLFQKCLAAPTPPLGLKALQEIGWNPSYYALFFTILDCSFIICFIAAALVIFWKCNKEIIGLLGTLVLISFGISFPSLMSVASEHIPLVSSISNIMNFIGWSSLTLFFLLFPNGKFVPKWGKWIFFLIGALLVISFFDIPQWVVLLRLIIMFGFLLFSQIYRYKMVSTQVERQQTKWVVYGLSISLIGFLCVVFIPMLFNTNINEEGNLLYFLIFVPLVDLLILLIPITLIFALLRRRLWDIDPLLNRSLLYGAMMLFVIVVYIVVVWYLSHLFKTNSNIFISIIATSIVAVSFSPMKEKVERFITQKMYGLQGNPYVVMGLLGKTLQQSQTPEQLIEEVVRTIKDVLRLPYASIQIDQEPLAQAGIFQEEVHHFPISYRSSHLGVLTVAPRSPGEAFTSSDQQLWEVLIQQLGPLLQDLKTTLDLKELNRDLQHSREKLVLAREEERHHLRRNLHDDLAPRLAALAYTAAAAEDLIEKEPKIVKELLIEHQKMILGTVDDIRRLVYDLRPPSLDELGLVGALKQRIQEITAIKTEEGAFIPFTFEAPSSLPSIPAAIEVAVYRIVSESVVNVVRHSKASMGTVKVELKNDRLQVEVTDNGIGFTEKVRSEKLGGLGLPSMKERAAELGGKLIVEKMEQGGTRVFGWVPVTTITRGNELEYDSNRNSR